MRKRRILKHCANKRKQPPQISSIHCTHFFKAGPTNLPTKWIILFQVFHKMFYLHKTTTSGILHKILIYHSIEKDFKADVENGKPFSMATDNPNHG